MAVVPVLDREELRDTQDRFRRFHEWEAKHPPVLTPQQALSAVAGLYRLLPAEARDRNDDPECNGFRRLLEAMALLRG
ncbi:MAG TPA: hypothetical protein VHK90_11860 [Thermoanaerobaculia bacterium]|nr:hypothetical protein [Thermoanaerobaculia bacterium]